MLAATSTDKREIQVQTTQLVALVRGDEVGRGNEGKNDYKWRTFGPNLQLATSTTMTALAGNPNGPSWSLSVRCTSQPNGGQLRPRRHFGLLQADELREGERDSSSSIQDYSHEALESPSHGRSSNKHGRWFAQLRLRTDHQHVAYLCAAEGLNSGRLHAKCLSGS